MGRTEFYTAKRLKKGAWTAEEDQKLISYIEKHGEGCWRSLPEKAGLQRCGKSSRLRWANYLRPGIKRGDFTSEEDQIIIDLHAALGNRWAAIARHLPKRTDNEIKNYWHAHLKKRLSKMGIDPVTRKPVGSTKLGSSNTNSSTMAESATTQEFESTEQQPKTRSTLALLLNKLASRVITLQCADPLRACHTMQSISSPHANNIENDKPTAPDTSTWLDIADPFTPNLPETLSPESAESNASDDGDLIVDNYNMEYSVSDALSILDNNASAPARSFLPTPARDLDNMASIDEVDDWQNNPPGDSDTTTTGDVALSGDINVDYTIYDMIGSPTVCDLDYSENELEPSDFFYFP